MKRAAWTGKVAGPLCLLSLAVPPTCALTLAAVPAASASDRAIALIPARPERARLPTVRGPRAAPLVVIDAGHGGRDPGSSGPHGTHEKDVALRIARAIRDDLIEKGHVRVALTREDDRFLALAERREIARALDADLFVSIHCDSATRSEARGVSIYTLAERSSDRAAASLAERENKADGGRFGEPSAATSVSSILIDLAQRETRDDATRFASLLGHELAPTVGLGAGFRRSAGLLVLRAPDVPSVLIETGYLSNTGDRALLQSVSYRRVLAEGVARAIEAYFAPRPIRSGAAKETMR